MSQYLRLLCGDCLLGLEYQAVLEVGLWQGKRGSRQTTWRGQAIPVHQLDRALGLAPGRPAHYVVIGESVSDAQMLLVDGLQSLVDVEEEAFRAVLDPDQARALATNDACPLDDGHILLRLDTQALSELTGH